jgi:hypothetical protein
MTFSNRWHRRAIASPEAVSSCAYPGRVLLDARNKGNSEAKLLAVTGNSIRQVRIALKEHRTLQVSKTDRRSGFRSALCGHTLFPEQA